jgi:hypothetical protein
MRRTIRLLLLLVLAAGVAEAATDIQNSPARLPTVATTPYAGPTALAVNTATGSDGNPCTVALPCQTLTAVAAKLAWVQISTPITIAYAGTAVAGDTPVFTFVLSYAISYGATGVFPVQIIGTPTVLYTGSVTTSTPITAGATTTDNEIADTAIPTSYTASGLLAKGVIFKRTSSTALYWFAAKDLGTKTLRISQPNNGLGFTDSNLAVNDTYTASSLPTVNQLTFATLNQPYSVNIQLISLATSFYTTNEGQVLYLNDWFPNGATFGGDVTYFNCAVSGGSNMYGANGHITTGAWADGLMIGTGNSSFALFTVSNYFLEQRVTFQGVKFQVQQSSVYIANDLVFNDTTSTSGGIQLINNASAQWNGTFQGSNNAGLARAASNSVLSITTTTPFVAGSSTDTTTPIKSVGTSSTNVAGYTAGNTVLNTSGNGIYKTQ